MPIPPLRISIRVYTINCPFSMNRFPNIEFFGKSGWFSLK
jgi:hypothetical protein